MSVSIRLLAKQVLWFFVDQCHLRWGDALGYVWGPRGERVDVPMLNEAERQTYYGALNLVTGRAVTFPTGTANGEETVRFLRWLWWRVQCRPMIIVWDGAPYHRSDTVKAYLQRVNGDRAEAERRIQLIQFAPHAPEQNPMEDVWLAAKTAVRQAWYRLDPFRQVRQVFTQTIECTTFQFHKLEWYWSPQKL
jgi:transposase